VNGWRRKEKCKNEFVAGMHLPGLFCKRLENSGILADLYCLFSVTNLILLAELQA
jgi:hypothetical protein